MGIYKISEGVSTRQKRQDGLLVSSLPSALLIMSPLRGCKKGQGCYRRSICQTAFNMLIIRNSGKPTKLDADVPVSEGCVILT